MSGEGQIVEADGGGQCAVHAGYAPALIGPCDDCSNAELRAVMVAEGKGHLLLPQGTASSGDHQDSLPFPVGVQSNE